MAIFDAFQKANIPGVRVLGETWEDREPSRTFAYWLIMVVRACAAAGNGSNYRHATRWSHQISGTVADIAGVESFSIDGDKQFAIRGRWAADVPVRWGSCSNIITSDGENEVSTFCYYAADRFADGELPHMDALQLRLAQSALDDGDPNAPIRSLGDAVRRGSIVKDS